LVADFGFQTGGRRYRKNSAKFATYGLLKPALHIYEVRRRKDHRGVDLISDALPSNKALQPTAAGPRGFDVT